MKPNQLKRGHVVRWNNDLWKVVGISHVTKGNWASYYQIELKNLKQGKVLTNRFAVKDDLEYVEIATRPMQYLYQDGSHYVFMDSESYEQVLISEEEIEEEVPYLKLNAEVKIQFVDEKPIALELPTAVELEVVECDPGMKGDSVSNVFKPAKLETGLEVKVPLHINQGEIIKVDTRTGEFLERASK